MSRPHHALGEIVLYRHWDGNIYAGIVTRVHKITEEKPQLTVSIHIFYPEAVEQRSQRLGDIECVSVANHDTGQSSICWFKRPYQDILG